MHPPNPTLARPCPRPCGGARFAVRALVLSVLLAGGFAGAAGTTPSALAGDAQEKAPDKPARTVDPEAVLAGDPKSDWQKPASVDPDLVYAEIEEYKKIVEEKLDASDPRYQVLMSKASRRFACAVRAAAKDGSYDLVARTGAVKGVDHVPDITADVIKKL
jgi:hypothetical protein